MHVQVAEQGAAVGLELVAGFALLGALEGCVLGGGKLGENAQQAQRGQACK